MYLDPAASSGRPLALPANGTLTSVGIKNYRNLPDAEKPLAYLPEAETTAYPSKESREAFVDLKEVFAREKVPAFFNNPYATFGDPYQGRTYVRESLAEILVQAARTVQKESKGAYALLIDEGHRPLEVQKTYFEAHWKEVAKEILAGQPQWVTQLGLENLHEVSHLGARAHFESSQKSISANQRDSATILHRSIWDKVTSQVADPKLTPPHSTGGAVDVLLCDAETGKSVHSTGTDVLSENSHTFSTIPDANERQRRELLYRAMTSAGAINLATEFWHYSFGDQYWAAATGAEHALYESKTTSEVALLMQSRTQGSAPYWMAADLILEYLREAQKHADKPQITTAEMAPALRESAADFIAKDGFTKAIMESLPTDVIAEIEAAAVVKLAAFEQAILDHQITYDPKFRSKIYRTIVCDLVFNDPRFFDSGASAQSEVFEKSRQAERRENGSDLTPTPWSNGAELFLGIENKSTPGFAVVAFIGDKVVAQSVVGEAILGEQGASVSPTTQFNIASLTKAAVGLAMTKLHNAGLVDFNMPAADYILNDCPSMKRLLEGVSLKHLLTHESGLPNYTDWCDDQEQLQAAMAALGETRDVAAMDNPYMLRLVGTHGAREFEPGTATEYSNTNYVVLARVIEKLTGQKFADYMRNEIFLPLGMRDTFVGADNPALHAKALSYRVENGAWALQIPPAATVGDGAVLTTLDDWKKWNRAMVGSFPEVVTEKDLTLMHTQVTLDNGKPINRGLGIYINSDGHLQYIGEGEETGYHSIYVRLPGKNFGFALFSNGTFEWNKLYAVARRMARPYIGQESADILDLG